MTWQGDSGSIPLWIVDLFGRYYSCLTAVVFAKQYICFNWIITIGYLITQEEGCWKIINKLKIHWRNTWTFSGYDVEEVHFTSTHIFTWVMTLLFYKVFFSVCSWTSLSCDLWGWWFIEGQDDSKVWILWGVCHIILCYFLQYLTQLKMYYMIQ